jgi:hypothetical protein
MFQVKVGNVLAVDLLPENMEVLWLWEDPTPGKNSTVKKAIVVGHWHEGSRRGYNIRLLDKDDAPGTKSDVRVDRKQIILAAKHVHKLKQSLATMSKSQPLCRFFPCHDDVSLYLLHM